MAKIPLHPKNPDRICWGCDKFCPADDLRCGNGTVRTQHPVELFGEDWLELTASDDQQPASTDKSSSFRKAASGQLTPADRQS